MYEYHLVRKPQFAFIEFRFTVLETGGRASGSGRNDSSQHDYYPV
jgi:hypothetical protein